jgi:hypothetical protein
MRTKFSIAGNAGNMFGVDCLKTDAGGFAADVLVSSSWVPISWQFDLIYFSETRFSV